MDVQATVDYWIDLSEYDIVTAEVMLRGGRYLYVGFMAHQSVEKALKAIHWHLRKTDPPYTHDLRKLARSSEIEQDLPERFSDILDELQPLNIETRYPKDKEQLLQVLTKSYSQSLISRTKEPIGWIRNRYLS